MKVSKARPQAKWLDVLDLLPDVSDPSDFISAVLQAIGSQLRASHVLLWQFDGRSGNVAARLAWSAAAPVGDQTGRLPSAVTDELLALARQPAAVDTPPTGQLHVPLSAGGVRLGGVAIRLQRAAPVPDEQFDVARVLASQIGLVLGLESRCAAREAMILADERTRMAREIHDGVAQSFIGISRHLRNAGAPADSIAVAKAVALANEGLAQARRSIHALFPQPLAGRSFPDAVREVARNLVPHEIRFELLSSGVWPALAPERETHLLRVVQEALSNAARHASATRLVVELSVTAQELSILIHDDGCGFDPDFASEGFGLTFMRQRIEAIHGQFSVQSTRGAGTQVAIRLAVA